MAKAPKHTGCGQLNSILGHQRAVSLNGLEKNSVEEKSRGKYGDVLVLLVQLMRFGEMLGRISRLTWLNTDKSTADKMTAKLY